MKASLTARFNFMHCSVFSFAWSSWNHSVQLIQNLEYFKMLTISETKTQNMDIWAWFHSFPVNWNNSTYITSHRASHDITHHLRCVCSSWTSASIFSCMALLSASSKGWTFCSRIKYKGSIQKKKCNIFYIGGGSGPFFVTLFFSKTWSKMA